MLIVGASQRAAEDRIQAASNEASLDLSGLKLTWLPRSIESLSQLQILDLSDNLLTSLPESIISLPQLRELDLSNNQLSMLSESIENLSQLRKLDLSNNQLSMLPENIGNLSQLRILLLSNNHLTMLPENIGNLSQLQMLVLWNNRIMSLPESIINLSQLLILDLWNNLLTALPESIISLPQLRQLDLAGNRLTMLPESIKNLSHLQELDASNNQLTTLPRGIGYLSQLQELDLWNNKLVSLPRGIANLHQLRHLDLSDNRMKTLPKSIIGLPQLRQLDLSNNGVTMLPESVENLSQLQELDLSYNALIAIPDSLLNLGEKCDLKALYLHGNPWLPIPPEILGPTHVECLKNKVQPANALDILQFYFAQRHANVITRPLNEAKVLLIGEAEVGKSSLIAALSEGKLEQLFDKTRGIVRNQWSATDDLRLNLWDFGGQEVYHATHSFFLTERALYLVVVDARANDRQNNIDYWLRMAQSFGGGAPILVAVNKCEQHTDGPDEHALLRKYGPELKGFFRTSCHTGEGLENLKQTILSEVNSMPEVRREMPESWLSIKRKLEQMTDDTLSMNAYSRLCEECGEPNAGNQRILLDLWHKLGTVLYFHHKPEDPPEMKNLGILNPEWVTRGVYAVLDDESLRERRGLLTDGELHEALSQAGYTDMNPRYIECMMRRFDLLYDAPDPRPRRMLVPQLLPENEPELQWSENGCLQFIYRYEVLPAGLLPRFIVRNHRYLSTDTGPWRHGCILQIEDCQALVRADIEARQVVISVRGEPSRSRDALDKVRHFFENIHSEIKDIPVEQYIPVPNHPEAPHINYRLLRDLEREGESHYKVPGARGERLIRVDIQEVLSGVRSAERQEQEKQESKNQMIFNAPVYGMKGIDMSEDRSIHQRDNVGVQGTGDHGTMNQYNSTQGIEAGDLNSLLEHMRQLHVPQEDVRALEVAVQEDPTPEPDMLGGRVAAWVGGITQKALTGTIAGVGTAEVIEAIHHFYGH